MDGRLTMTALVIFLAAARADPYVGTDDDGNLQPRAKACLPTASTFGGVGQFLKLEDISSHWFVLKTTSYYKSCSEIQLLTHP